jgi:poly(A) polymerase
LRPAPLVTGDDLVALGLSPGPRFKTVLDAVYDLQLNGALAGRAEALEAAKSLGTP